jgi:hypothetical protein
LRDDVGSGDRKVRKKFKQTVDARFQSDKYSEVAASNADKKVKDSIDSRRSSDKLTADLTRV